MTKNERAEHIFCKTDKRKRKMKRRRVKRGSWDLTLSDRRQSKKTRRKDEKKTVKMVLNCEGLGTLVWPLILW